MVWCVVLSAYEILVVTPNKLFCFFVLVPLL